MSVMDHRAQDNVKKAKLNYYYEKITWTWDGWKVSNQKRFGKYAKNNYNLGINDSENDRNKINCSTTTTFTWFT